MTIQLAVSTRNARLDAIETDLGPDPIMKLWPGAIPADCAAADAAGPVISTINLPTDWMNDASGGSKTLKGTWQDTVADNAGTVTHFRVYVGPAGTVCKIQGTVTSVLVGTGDMLLDNVVVAAGQVITIVTFTLTDGNA